MTSPEEERVQHVLKLEPGLTRERAVALIQLVARHDVRWEVWPERQAVGEEIRQIGFELDLLAVHAQPRHPVVAGCDECQRLYLSLREIASFALPKDLRASRYDIALFDRSLREPNETSSGYVTLTVRILHRGRFNAPPDSCEVECLLEIEAKLTELGARCSARHLGRMSDPPAHSG